MSMVDWQSKLATGEQLLWSGTPERGLLVTDREKILLTLTILPVATFIMLAIWMWYSSTDKNDVYGAIFFVIYGIMFTIGRFAFDAWLRSRTSYALTDRRILIWRRAPLQSLVTINLDEMPEVGLADVRKSRGTIRFGRSLPVFGRLDLKLWVPSLDKPPQFLAIEDPRSVMELLQAAIRNAIRQRPQQRDLNRPAIT